MQRMQTFAAAATLGLALAGCGGGAGLPSSQTGTPSSGSAIPASTSAATGDARTAPGSPGDALPIQALNAFGAPIKVLSEENATDQGAARAARGTGACNRRVETFVPDRAGDPNSSEIEFFYDAACTHVARDTVRTFTSTGPNAENVSLTTKNFLADGAQASLRTATAQLSNATFGPNGVPMPADGFNREASSQLTVGANRKIVLAGSEIIVAPAVNGAGSFCSDAAAYNSVGFARLDETFGWSGVLANGIRTEHADGSVTWTGTHKSTVVDGVPGSLSLVTGTPNAACPIATPAYSISGGTDLGGATSTISVTFFHGAVANLTVSGASLSGGYTTRVTTNTKLWPASTNYITGVIAHDGATIASFAVNAFGDGTLTLSKRGFTFTIVDWSVIR